MRSRHPAVIGLAVAGAQGGHLLAYRLRFGSLAQQLQSTGAHSYFPILVKSALGVLALTFLASLLVIGAARVVARGHGVRAAGGPSFVGLLAALFTLQLALFLAQEVVEARVAGVPPDSATHLLLWGMAGQLPVAVAGAAVLTWLGGRFEQAVSSLGSVVPAATRILLAPVSVRTVTAGGQALAVLHSTRSRLVRRGPPGSSSFRPF